MGEEAAQALAGNPAPFTACARARRGLADDRGSAVAPEPAPHPGALRGRPLPRDHVELALALDVVGYLAPAAARLAQAGISMVPQCAFQKDHLLVPASRAADAVRVLRGSPGTAPALEGRALEREQVVEGHGLAGDEALGRWRGGWRVSIDAFRFKAARSGAAWCRRPGGDRRMLGYGQHEAIEGRGRRERARLFEELGQPRPAEFAVRGVAGLVGSVAEDQQAVPFRIARDPISSRPRGRSGVRKGPVAGISRGLPRRPSSISGGWPALKWRTRPSAKSWP